MAAVTSRPTVRPGDRIVVESERVGQPAREGEIVVVVESRFGPSYDILWDDGRRSSFRPAGGSATIIPRTRKVRPKH
jgi:Domain of unknown function (DUF1918)